MNIVKRIHHPVQWAIVLGVELVCIAEWCARPSAQWPAIVLSAAQCVLIVLAPIRPRMVFVIALVCDASMTMLYTDTAATPIYALVTVIGFLAYQTNNATTFAALCAASIAQLLETAAGGASGGRALVAFLVTFVFAALLGSALRWREQFVANQHAAQVASIRLRDSEKAIRAANEIHSAVTNQMSSIARIAQRQIRLGLDGDQQPWAIINDAAMEALSNTHRAIEYLQQVNGDATSEKDSSHEDLVKGITRMMEEDGGNLRALGFSGSVTTQTDTPVKLSADKQHLILTLLHEIHTNIVRHAPHGCHYELSVLLTRQGVEVTQINPLAAHESITDLPVGRYGLHGLQQDFSAYGGTLSAECEGDMWVVFAFLPADGEDA